MKPKMLLYGQTLLLVELTRVKVNFWLWVKWVPLARMPSEGEEPRKVCSTSERSEVEALLDGGSTAERSCSSIRL